MSKVWQPNETYNSKARAAMEKVLGLLNIGLRVARVVNGLKIEYQQTQLLTSRSTRPGAAFFGLVQLGVYGACYYCPVSLRQVTKSFTAAAPPLISVINKKENNPKQHKNKKKKAGI